MRWRRYTWTVFSWGVSGASLLLRSQQLCCYALTRGLASSSRGVFTAHFSPVWCSLRCAHSSSLSSRIWLGMEDAAGTISFSLWLLTSMCELGNPLSVGRFSDMMENSLWVNEHRKVRLFKNFKILDMSRGWEKHRVLDNWWGFRTRIWVAMTIQMMCQAYCTRVTGSLFL